MKRNQTIQFSVKDFDLKQIFECGQCFRWDEAGGGSFIGIAGGRVAVMHTEEVPGGKKGEKTLTITRVGTDNDSNLSERTKSKQSLNNYSKMTDEEFWHSYLDLDRDYGSIKRKLKRRDSTGVMKEVIPYGEGIRILKQDPWEATLSFIISQNNNIPRIKNNIRDISKLFGKKICKYNGEEWYDVPRPETLAKLQEEDLAPVRLGYRAKYIIETARCVAERGTEVIENEVDCLCGVGPKVASCIRLFGLGKIDSFPIDVWVKRVMEEMYGITSMSKMEKFANDTFGEYGGIAQQYLFYYIREKS